MSDVTMTLEERARKFYEKNKEGLQLLEEADFPFAKGLRLLVEKAGVVD